MELDFATQVQIAADEMDVDLASLYIYENNKLFLRATFGLTDDSIGRVSMKLDEGLTGLVYTSGRALPVSEPSQHPRYRYFPASGEEDYHSYLGVPLPEALGVLVFQTRAAHFYSQSEVRAATLWAERLARDWQLVQSKAKRVA